LAAIMLALTVVIALDTVRRCYVLLVNGITQPESPRAVEESA